MLSIAHSYDLSLRVCRSQIPEFQVRLDRSVVPNLINTLGCPSRNAARTMSNICSWLMSAMSLESTRSTVGRVVES